MASKHASWEFAEGDEIVPGRMAVKVLGGGPRNEAWLAWDTAMHTIVVVKLLRPSHVDLERARRSMVREARILRKLQHPAIVRMFDAHVNGPRPYLILELLDGPRISTLIRHYGRLTEEQLVPLGLEVASALAFMHKAGYVHLDVKPQNIIMSATPRLIDLGLVRTFGEMKDLAHTVGTDAYMAPEQCSADTIKFAGPPADVWGLGVTLYQAAMTRRPFPAATDELRFPQTQMTPEWPDKRVPPVMAKVIMSCLESDPSARPTASELAAELEALVEEARLVAGKRLRSRYRR